MASNDQVAPRKKHIDLDPISSNDNSLRSLNSLFPKINNLEYFPLIVLLKIFALVGDIGLLNLAENSTRFEKIAKMVLNERYAEKYLPLNARKYNSQRYDDFLRLFGNNIKAIHTRDLDIKGENYWTVSLLNRTTNIKKLKLELLRSGQSNEFLLQECVPSDITHLTLRICSHVAEQGFVQFVLPKFHDLQTLKLIDDPCISLETLRDVIHNNLGLESFCITDDVGCATMILKEYPFDKLMVLFGSVHLNQLKEFAYLPIYGLRSHMGDLQAMVPIRQPDHIVDAFVGSLKHLESLALSVLGVDYFTDPVELLYRFATQCRNIKNLKLYSIHTYDEVFEAIKLFERIECLLITSSDFEYNSIVSLVEKLPFLHHLHIKIGMFEKDWSFVLVVISKCLRLEKLIVSFERVGYCSETFQSAQFFNDFRECVQTRNVTIEVVWRDFYETIGTITKDQVIWRKKLVRWVGYDPNRNPSQTNLMHLVNQSMTIDSSDCEQHKPFARILDYLDLNSLQSLSKTNGKCSQLIDNYVKQYSKQQRTFTITNEFFTALNLDYKRLDDELVEHVTSLRVNICHHNINELRGIIQKFPNLNKLFVYTSNDIEPTDMIFPQVRHFIFDGFFFQIFSQLYELSCLCPDLEIMEFKQKNSNDSKSTVKCLEFRNLQKFTFKFYNSVQLENMQALFKDTNTELNVVYDHTI